MSGESTADERPRYRPCPECSVFLLRHHYGRRGGIVIDVCRKHGIWFDAEELPRILDWIRRGGLAQAQAELDREAELTRRRKSTRPPSRWRPNRNVRRGQASSGDFWTPPSTR